MPAYDIDLTLDSLKIPNINGTFPFGTKITPTAENKGGLSTAEVNSNIMLPFAQMRPKVVTEDSITTVVEYDAKIVFSASLQEGVDLTLLAGDYEGCRIQLTNLSTFICTISYNNVLIGSVISEETVEIMWTGSTWAIFGSVPVGSVISYSGSAAPIGWHLCNGATANRADYPYLIKWAIQNDLIGNDKLIGAGDGETTFTFPDLRECVLVGAGQSARSILDTTGHSHDVYTVGQFKDDQVQTHNHNVSHRSGSGDYGAVPNGALTVFDGSGPSGNNSGRSGTTTHGKQVGMNYIIKI